MKSRDTDRVESNLSWENIGDIEGGRKNLGETMPVLVYRLMFYTIKDELLSQFGNEKTIEILRNAGRLAGTVFAKNVLDLDVPFNIFINQLQGTLLENKIGILRVEEMDFETGNAVLTVSEDLDCSGLPITGENVCNYDEGFLAGILEVYTKKEYKVTEVDCWATGARVCRFKANVVK